MERTEVARLRRRLPFFFFFYSRNFYSVRGITSADKRVRLAKRQQLRPQDPMPAQAHRTEGTTTGPKDRKERTGTGAGLRTGKRTVVGTGVEAGTETETETGTETAAAGETGSGTGKGTKTGAGSDTGAGTGADTRMKRGGGGGKRARVFVTS